MSAKTPQLQIFMTVADEADFSAQVKASNPYVLFFGTASFASSRTPDVKDRIDACSGVLVLLLDAKQLSLEEYCARFVTRHPSGVGYYANKTNKAIGIFGRCRVPLYDQDGLESGSIGAGYDTTDPGSDRFIKSIMNITRKGGKRVYDIDPATGTPFDKPAPGYWAWPDAARIYDGTAGHYLRPDAINRMVAR